MPSDKKEEFIISPAETQVGGKPREKNDNSADRRGVQKELPGSNDVTHTPGGRGNGR